MVAYDERRQELIGIVNRTEEALENANFDLFCYDKKEVLSRKELKQGRNFHYTPPLNVLVSETPIERCAFDNKIVKRMGLVFGGSEKKDTTIYRCPKCSVHYQSPLNAKDEESINRARKVRYAKR